MKYLKVKEKAFFVLSHGGRGPCEGVGSGRFLGFGLWYIMRVVNPKNRPLLPPHRFEVVIEGLFLSFNKVFISRRKTGYISSKSTIMDK